MNYKEYDDKIRTIIGFMGSERQREYMFELGKQSICAAEIGTWKGLSASIVGFGMLEGNNNGKYYCIDTFESTYCNKDCGEIVAEYYVVGENTWKTFNQLIDNFNLQDIIVPIRGYSYHIDTLKQIPNNLDFLYIDGNHESEAVLLDTILYASKVKLNGLILYHDHTFDSVQNAIKQAIELKIISFIDVIDDFGIYTVNKK